MIRTTDAPGLFLISIAIFFLLGIIAIYCVRFIRKSNKLPYSLFFIGASGVVAVMALWIDGQFIDRLDYAITGVVLAAVTMLAAWVLHTYRAKRAMAGPSESRARFSKQSLSLLAAMSALVIGSASLFVIHSRDTFSLDGTEGAVSILFVGNSHTIRGNVPGQLQTLARAHGVEIVYRNISRNGASLQDTIENAIRDIRAWDFDYVVLQCLNMRAISNFDGFMEGMRILSEEARASGATPVLYHPAWVNTDGRPDPELHRLAGEAFARAAEELGAIFVNAGEAWVYAYQATGIPLFSRLNPTGTHANNAGAFLTACVFAAVMFDLQITEIPRGSRYSGGNAAALAQAAWGFVH